MKTILFNTEMVRAILDCIKTATRKCIKHKISVYEENGKTYVNDNRYMLDFNLNAYIDSHAKYKKGDILYVKETWCKVVTDVDKIYFEDEWDMWDGMYLYKTDGYDLSEIGRWHPSIHMPQGAARLFLRITRVELRKLQDIRYHEVYREGIKSVDVCNSKCHSTLPCAIKQADGERYVIDAFKEFWNKTIKQSELDQFGWDANPWVWVYEFEVISKDEAMKEENNASNCVRK